MAVVGADFLEPAAIEPQEIAKPAAAAVECIVQERRVGRRQAVDLGGALAELFELDGQEQRTGVVVGAVALGEVGDRRVGVLEHAGRVGHSHQVVQPPARQIHRLFGQGADRQRLVRRVEPASPRSLERFHVEVSDVAPDHLATQHVGLFPHRVPPGLVAQQLADLASQRRRIVKRNQDPATVGQQLFGVPVGRRDDGLAAAEGVRQRSRRDLRRVQIGRDVDVGHADEFDQLVDLDEPVVEADVGLDAQVLGEPLEADSIAFPLLAQQVGMGCPQHDVDEVGKFAKDRGHRPQHPLDSLVGRQQTERERDELALDRELILVEIGIDERHVGDAVRDQVDLGVGNVVDVAKKVRARSDITTMRAESSPI